MTLSAFSLYSHSWTSSDYYPLSSMTERIIETRTCTHCSEQFAITDIDQDFLTRLAPMISGQRFELPFPTHCPKCRKIRRYAWRNEKNIYKRKCDATGKDIISLFSPDAPCPVYESDYWYSDDWDAHKYGRDFDFSRSFFEQWWELKKVVPMPGKSVWKWLVNSEYSDNCSYLKNCYLCFNGSKSEDCLYSTDIWNCSRVIDWLSIVNCHECYQLLDARDCYATHFSYDVNTCRDSYFLTDCYGCQNCYGCVDLKNQQYHIYNTPYTEEEYKKRLTQLLILPIEKQQADFIHFMNQSGYNTHRTKVLRSENVSDSSRIFDSKNVSHANIINRSEDIRYTSRVLDTRLLMDVDLWWDRLDRSYESIVVGEACSSSYFTHSSWENVSNLYYSAFCVGNVHHCFGCIGLRNAEYCILNKQYTKEEYEELVPRIIENMIHDEEWGEFFPAKYSHIGYNQSMNMEKYPLTKNEALKQWFYWSDYETPSPKVEKIIPGSKLPDDISKIPDDILSWAIECEVTKKPFRIVKPELDFYRKHHLPIPRKHPDERYRERTKIYLNY